MAEAETPRWTREDLVQVEHDLYSIMLRDARKKALGEPRVGAAEHLGIDEEDVIELNERVVSIDLEPVQLELARQIEASGLSEVLTGATADQPVVWTSVQRRDERVRVPQYVSIPFPPGSVATTPLLVRAWTTNQGTALNVNVMAKAEDEAAAEAYMAELLASATGPRSPYRHEMVEAYYGPTGLALKLVDLEPVDRGSLVLGQEVWDAVHRNVDRMFERMDRLAEAGLGTNRGMVLAGPPGTGKSALCRALAHEYVGQATITIMSASAGEHLLGQVYERLNDLGPALVLIEDLDLLVGDREQAARHALVQFLTVLDGLMTRHGRVVTIATTNDAEMIDDAAVRAARFDQVVSLRLPDAAQRTEILASYLRRVEHTGDLGALGQASDGFSGSDLREVVRSAVLDAEDATVQSHELVAALERRRDALRATPGGPTGAYA